MKRIIFIIVILFVACGLFILKNSNKHKPVIKEKFNITFDKDLLHSNLYPPIDVVTHKITDSSVEISWKFPDRELIVPNGMAIEYAILSGFRIYRDGYWLTDIQKSENSYTDTGLYPDEKYTYAISAITFDNKIEGQISKLHSVRTEKGKLKSINYPVKKPGVYLALGDSITQGQRATINQGWVNQVAFFLKQNNQKFIYYNNGVSGAYSNTVLDTLKQELIDTDADFVTLAVGLNDLIAASRDIGNYSMLELKHNLVKSISAVNPKQRSLLLLNIYYFECCYRQSDKTDKRLAWNKLIRDIANEYGIYMVDVSSAMELRGGKELLGDTLHPNQAGHNVIAKEVIKIISTAHK